MYKKLLTPFSNEDCRWKITAPQGVIKVTVLNYDIERAYNCGFDSLNIKDGKCG